jgi:hypothetical protein
VTEDSEIIVEHEDEADQTGANRFDADVAKAQARKEMWKTVQKAFDNIGKIGGLVGLVLGGYATCVKADATDTEQRLDQHKGAIEKTNVEVKEAKEATGLVLDYTTAVASSASAAVAAVASSPPPAPMVKSTPPPAGSAGCWVARPGGLVRCKPASSSSSAAPQPPPMPKPPSIKR